MDSQKRLGLVEECAEYMAEMACDFDLYGTISAVSCKYGGDKSGLAWVCCTRSSDCQTLLGHFVLWLLLSAERSAILRALTLER